MAVNLGGYRDRVARIDLSSGEIAYEGLNAEDIQKYIGGRGLGVKYVFDNGPGVEPFSPENILAFMLGPLSGTEVNLSGRVAICTKSPLTGTVVDSHHGGWSGARLKWAGFDGLIFKGRSEHPVYAYVHDGNVSLHDASDIWGRGTRATVKALRERHGSDCSVMCIGPGGEHRVRFAGIMNEDDRASGRGGTGAVAGDKRLKAIVVHGNRSNMPKAADPVGFREAHRRALATLMDEANVTAPRKGGLSVYGTNVLTSIVNEMGALPTKNGFRTAWEHAHNHSGEHINDTILVDDPTCHACPVACKKMVETPEGKFHVRGESYEYESAWALGAFCLNSNRDSIAYMIDLCNEYGIDTIELGNVMAVTMEASERGLTGEKLEWGDADKMVDLTHKLVARIGIGDTLANGAERAAAAFGDPAMSMTCKGQGIPAYDPRGLKGMGLGYATSNRGACHLRGYTVASEILGIPEKTDPLAWQGKGELCKTIQDLFAMTDSLDVCKFTTFAEGAEEYAWQLSTFVGIKVSADDVMKIGERIYNLERHYNNLAGFREGSDTLPKRFLELPSDAEGSKGHICELDQMLGEYYLARGWDNGVVPDAKLRELAII
jgi:aldehyde:ferredoxin oxidoreductase